jgi:hypothetical protein
MTDMSQRISFVLSELTAVQNRDSLLALNHSNIHSLPTRAVVASSTTPESTKQPHHIINLDPPTLPKRSACLCTCLLMAVAFWCVATTVLALMYVARGGTTPGASGYRILLPMRDTHEVGRLCTLSVRTSEADTSSAEVVAALVLTVRGLDVDKDVSVTTRGRHVFDVILAGCDRVMEDAFAGDALVNAWSTNLARMRGAKLTLSYGPVATEAASPPSPQLVSLPLTSTRATRQNSTKSRDRVGVHFDPRI